MKLTPTIPVITIDWYDEVYIEHTFEILRITREELAERIYSNQQHDLNARAERYIATYLRNDIDGLNTENWLALKDLYIQYALYANVEAESESEDKKEALDKMLDLFNKKNDDSGSNADLSNPKLKARFI